MCRRCNKNELLTVVCIFTKKLQLQSIKYSTEIETVVDFPDLTVFVHNGEWCKFN